MSKKVKDIRKSIEQRKKHQRTGNIKGAQAKKVNPVFPQEEEKHGYYPVLPDSTAKQSNGSRGSRPMPGILVKGGLAILLFISAGFFYQTDSEKLHKPAEWTIGALTQEFPFAKVYQWYHQTFGEPLGLSSGKTANESAAQADQTLALPVSGKVTESFQANGSGIRISPEQTTDVSVLRKGVVLFAGNDRETDKTVVVQHSDGSISTYGYLSSLDVHVYQHVKENQKLGEFVPDDKNETVFFSIQKDHEYMDPVQVIKVDDAT